MLSLQRLLFESRIGVLELHKSRSDQGIRFHVGRSVQFGGLSDPLPSRVGELWRDAVSLSGHMEWHERLVVALWADRDIAGLAC
jgi:hypothetical protein